MLKFISYPILMLSSFLIMGYTGPSIIRTAHDLAKPLPAKVLKNSAVNKPTTSPGRIKSGFFTQWQLGNMGLSENAFTYAMKGFAYLSKSKLVGKKNIVTIVDFSKPSTQKRLYVIDLSSGKILFNTWVAHGQNSGNEYANKFSNSPESHQSSLGFYITMDTYTGGNGYSLRLKGCEKGINDKAFERSIVIHGADYVGDKFIKNNGAPGRSFGCPAIPSELSKKIIDIIKNGSCLFLYHPTKKYCRRSKILNYRV